MKTDPRGFYNYLLRLSPKKREKFKADNKMYPATVVFIQAVIDGCSFEESKQKYLDAGGIDD